MVVNHNVFIPYMVTIVSDIVHIWTLIFKGNMHLYDNVNKSSINMSKPGADPGFDQGGGPRS